MSPSNTPNNTALGMVSASKPNAKPSGSKNTEANASKDTLGFNAVFGQAFEKKQSAQSTLGVQNKAGAVFGDDLRSNPQTTSSTARNPESKAKNRQENTEDNRAADALAQNLAAQQMASTNTWAQTKATPKPSDQEWQPNNTEASKRMQSQPVQSTPPTNRDTNNQEQTTNDTPQNEASKTNETSKSPNSKNTEDKVAQRINQITQAVVQNNGTNTGDTSNTSLSLTEVASTNANLELNTPPTNSAETTQTTMAVKLGTEIPTTSGMLEINPDEQNQTQASTANNSIINTTTPVAVQQVMAQREAMYGVNGSSKPESKQNMSIDSLASVKAETEVPSNTATPSPSVAVFANNLGSNTPSISTRLGTPVNQPGFAKELGHTVQWAIGKNISTVDIRVNPESFGPLNMRIVQKGQDIQLIIRTQDEQSANMLQQAIGGLKETLANQGLQLNQISIQHGQSNPQSQTAGSSSGGASGNPSFSDQSKPNREGSQGTSQQNDNSNASATAPTTINNRAAVGGVDMFA